MTVKIYNSLTRMKQELVPITPGMIKLYVCGNTVYDYCHVGHGRTMIVFDVITRYLRARGFDVEYVRNITDIDDKIIDRANALGVSCAELTEKFIQAQHEDERALDIIPPQHEPRATQFIPQIIALVQKLLEKDMAYVAANGDVCFAVRRQLDYGKLSHRQLDDLLAGARVELGEAKRDPLDFVLWKLAKPNEPQWESPWGLGRPGWHIECSAMSSGLLGQPFDIHGGGMDLKFPHHENEIAQSEAAHQCTFAHLWMHSGLLQINGEKMSKSLGNFLTIRDVLQQHPAEEIRYFMLSGHYRSPVNYTEENLTQVHRSLTSLYAALRDLPEVEEDNTEHFAEKFYRAMDDDFNTPEAFAVLFEMAHEINRLRNVKQLEAAAQLAAGLKRLASVLGLLQEDPAIFLQGTIDHAEIKSIEALIKARNQARADKNWQAADDFRMQLSNMGIIIEDGPQGTTWRKV